MRSRRRYGVLRLRDRALAALIRHPDLLNREVLGLRACWIHRHDGTGDLVVRLPQLQGERVHYLDVVTSRALLLYLDAARLWGRDEPLFPGRDDDKPLSKDGLRRAIERLEGAD